MISKRVEATIEGWLRKREELEVEERQAFLSYVREMTNVEALATSRWFVNGTVRVPEDQPKVSQAIKVAKIAKVDPLGYNSPMELINQHQSVRLKGEAIDPNTVSTLHKVREFPEYGIEIFNVDYTDESRENMRAIINTHFGVNANPWCLLQADSEGKLTEISREYWKRYGGYRKQVCFVNGKLHSFSANSYNKRVWWNRNDAPYDGIPIKGKITNDPLGRFGTLMVDPIEGTVIAPPMDLYRGNKQDGIYETWYQNGQQRERCTYKEGKEHGLSKYWHENGQLSSHLNYKGGEIEGLWTLWYPNGQMSAKQNYVDGLRDGLREEWYSNGQLKYRGNYISGKEYGLCEEWHLNGQKKSRTNYFYENSPNYQSKDKVRKEFIERVFSEYWRPNGILEAREHFKGARRHGLCEEYYPNGQIETRCNYKNGVLDGLREEWYPNGQLYSRGSFKDGQRDDLYEEYHEDGQLSLRCTYKDGELTGLRERWWDNGQLREIITKKDGFLNGLYELRDRFGDIVSRRFYKNSYIIAEGEEALKLAEAEKQGHSVGDKKETKVPKKKGKSRGGGR